ncbi:bifunctional diguanylate cyclase/phosphodiesterase [Bacillus suaedaesalsae]|uniref:EAL domain-containing protein n=1 Tax=Bacillus suaedaesalsae TaxID=2810349 RepID=A0ABS2DEH1_9BACI|nr:EAL domain-containing protein [Bacillus suaedaesalsae]MBM6616862.1 EAL domain-containing protein [Bacillus suaedaesalsae]
MSIKKKISLTFTLLVMVILILNNYLQYMHSKDQLLDSIEREINLVTEEVTFQIENAQKGALYVENMIGRELRTASIAALNSLPPRHEDITNEQLVQIAKELNVSHITLFAKAEDDIVGVKSTDSHEIGIGTKEWGYWYTAFEQLFALEPVTVEEGLTLPNYWSGPIEIASSNPDHTDKWGYYYDGTTNYIINPYMRDKEVLEYEEKFGPVKVMNRFTSKLDGILEITVFNPETFGKADATVTINGNKFIKISDEPIWYGSYEYENTATDRDYIQKTLKTGKSEQYTEPLQGKDVQKTFIPVKDNEQSYVIGIAYDYGLVQQQLTHDLMDHIGLLLLSMVIVFIASSIYSRTITKPISYVVAQVNEIAKGNFGKRLKMQRTDEFGVLAENVNALSESLKIYTDDLVKSKKIIEFQAYHDPLTSLPNRRFIKEKVMVLEQTAKELNQPISIIFLDVDRFKHVNDTLGHNIGDELIVEISKRVLACVQTEKSIVARQGGDEFIILLENHNERDTMKIAEAIVETVKQPYKMGDHELYVSASCGISMYPEHSQDVETLIMYADMAMYEAKNLGGNKAVRYNEKMNDQNKERAQIESKLRKAIEDNMLEVYYQPKINAKTNELKGVEALVRWKDAELGFVSPALFIPIAEDTGLIQPLWEQIMEKSCKQVATWNKNREAKLALSVNFSARQFQDTPNIVEKVTSILHNCGLSPKLFEIEITESVLMYNTNETIQALISLQSAGMKIAIDDFGTGYSSMSYLTSLPINTLKIDQSFIQDITEEYQNSEIASAIINLVKSLQLEVIAEGVEKEHQKQYLLDHNCENMQGFYFSKPIPANLFEKQYINRIE